MGLKQAIGPLPRRSAQEFYESIYKGYDLIFIYL